MERLTRQAKEGEAHVAPLMVAMAFHPLLLLIALSWAFSAWRDDPPKDRQYFWLHPVERTAHTIARSLAGFIWLLLVVAIVVVMAFGIIAGLGWLISREATNLAAELPSYRYTLSQKIDAFREGVEAQVAQDFPTWPPYMERIRAIE